MRGASELSVDETPAGQSLATQGVEAFRVPFLFVTNGRPYVNGPLATKSGIWFWDARAGGGAPRALPEMVFTAQSERAARTRTALWSSADGT